jgi:hypothetical protein
MPFRAHGSFRPQIRGSCDDLVELERSDPSRPSHAKSLGSILPAIPCLSAERSVTRNLLGATDPLNLHFPLYPAEIPIANGH